MSRTELTSEILIRARRQVTIILFVVFAFFEACDSNENEPAPAPPPPAQCKLIRQASNGTSQILGVTINVTRSSSYGYDNKGNKLSASIEYKGEHSDGNREVTSSSAAYTYDDDAFLVRWITQQTRSNKDGLVSTQMSEIDYQYQTGRLSKASYKQVNDGVAITFSNSYEYDSEGRLVKFSRDNNEYTKFEYAGNRIQKITYVDPAGNSKSPFLQYNANGQLVKSIYSLGSVTTEWRYEYNANGDLTRHEQFNNGKPYNAANYEYDDKVNPNQVLQARFKGHPEFPDVQAYPAYNHNITKIVYFGVNGDKWVEGSTITNTYQYNANGVPTENITKSSDFGIQYASELTTYQYQDCN